MIRSHRGAWIFVAALVLLALGAPSAARADDKPCASEATCTRALVCPAGFKAHQPAAGGHACRKPAAAARTVSLSCPVGATMRHVAGVDVCERAISTAPLCQARGSDAARCRCPAGTALVARTSTCDGSVASPVWSARADAGDAVLEHGHFVPDFVGDKDVCLPADTEFAWAAPTIR